MTRSVFRFFSRQSSPVELAGDRLYLRMPKISDYRAWQKVRGESRAFLQPWEPKWRPDELSGSAYRARINRYEQEYEAGQSIALFIFERESDELLGGITIGLIRRGVAQSCMIGYWMGERHAGRGHMSRTLDLVIPHIFGPLELHRIEAACIADNTRSIRLLEKAGFQQEGFLRGYLKINGEWRDHVMYALLESDRNRNRKA
ncbi:GNAT family N-acetyltransferase [Gellertiella hungarica]|uniref:Ribosomal-protein-alanine N-acetyltransferase n=1 Tax=Gellertiella hungarica TaxID=1572859 RepID=A0A7W6J441_9HYPH|nr:GNAT family protein [Gellertiella hungarica]MBB4064456.1 ribosomal-protein-alanine N-acetyltransferase [Gellertiella hungarica]